MKTWRYQVVYVTENAMNGGHGTLFSLIEAFLYEDGRLEAWSAKSDAQWACGDDIKDLQRDLERMLEASRKWKPVRFEDLRTGMTFEPVE